MTQVETKALAYCCDAAALLGRRLGTWVGREETVRLNSSSFFVLLPSAVMTIKVPWILDADVEVPLAMLKSAADSAFADQEEVTLSVAENKLRITSPTGKSAAEIGTVQAQVMESVGLSQNLAFTECPSLHAVLLAAGRKIDRSPTGGVLAGIMVSAGFAYATDRYQATRIRLPAGFEAAETVLPGGLPDVCESLGGFTKWALASGPEGGRVNFEFASEEHSLIVQLSAAMLAGPYPDLKGLFVGPDAKVVTLVFPPEFQKAVARHDVFYRASGEPGGVLKRLVECRSGAGGKDILLVSKTQSGSLSDVIECGDVQPFAFALASSVLLSALESCDRCFLPVSERENKIMFSNADSSVLTVAAVCRPE